MENMDDKKVCEAIKALDGLTLLEWGRVQRYVDRQFRRKQSELGRKLKLTSADVTEATLERFV